MKIKFKLFFVVLMSVIVSLTNVVFSDTSSRNVVVDGVMLGAVALPIFALFETVPYLAPYLNTAFSLAAPPSPKIKEKLESWHYSDVTANRQCLSPSFRNLLRVDSIMLIDGDMDGAVGLQQWISLAHGSDVWAFESMNYINQFATENKESSRNHFRGTLSLGISVYPQAWWAPSSSYRKWGIEISRNFHSENSVGLFFNLIGSGIVQMRFGYIWNAVELQSIKHFGRGYFLSVSAFAL